MSKGLTLDSGALIAFERGDRAVALLLARARAKRIDLAVPACVVAQVWRDGRKQARLARFLASANIEIEPFDAALARAAGALCGATGTSDVVDASVAICAMERGHSVVTSDPDDLARLGPSLRLVEV